MCDNDYYDPANWYNPNFSGFPEDDYESEPEFEPDPEECDEPCCEICGDELRNFEMEYDGYCEECYTKTFHRQVWEEEQARRDWLEHINQPEEEEEEEPDETSITFIEVLDGVYTN